MRGSPKRDRLLPGARAMSARGLSVPQIADVLGVSRETLWRWQRRDRKDGCCWQRERELAHELHPYRVLRRPERRFAEMVMQGPPPPEPDEDGANGETQDPSEIRKKKREAERAHRKALLEMGKVIKDYGRTAGELTSQLDALEEFVLSCSEHLGRDEHVCMERAIERYLEELKRENL